MRKLMLTLIAAALAAGLNAETFTLDLMHGEVGFKVKHLMISTVTGKFKNYSGSFDFDPKKAVLKAVDITIDVASVDTNVEARDKHLRSGDFFLTEKYPTATFKAKGPVKVKAGEAVDVPGELTLRGVTKPVVLKVTYGGFAVSPYGVDTVAFEAETAINRTDYGVSFNKTLETGGVMISEEVKIVINGEANGPKPEAKKK
jgi:polyisoprenoid-binding protein YceI